MADPDKLIASTDDAPPVTPQNAVTEPVLATAPQAEPDTAPHLPMQPEPPQDPAPLPEPLISTQPAPSSQPAEPKLLPVTPERSDTSAAERGTGVGVGEGTGTGTGGGIDSRTAAGEAPAQRKASTETQPAVKDAGSGDKYCQMVVKHFFPVFAFLAFVAYVAVSFLPAGETGSALETWLALTLAVLLGAVALWFIHCMTGDAREKVQSLFVFAYAFTFGAFTLLLLPVLSDQVSTAAAKSGAVEQVRPHKEGALRLVRGCVREDAEGSKTLGLKLAPCPAEPPASAASLPAGISATSVRYAWLVSVGGVTARTLAFDKCDAAKGVAETAASAAKFAASDATLADRATAAEKRANAACAAHDSNDPIKSFVEVSGGIAVPLFVVVMALIGGAVSISRRIPEFQRRSDPQYVSTEKEPFMPPYRVREGVVFQIMQLISAPFLAIATMQVIEPNTLASASTLAFATGFFSETILYMIRGVVEGLKPEVTKVAGPVMTNLAGELVWQDPADPGDFAKVRVELQSERPVEWRNGPVDNDGKFVINGVTAGRYRLVIGGSGIMPVPAQDIEVDDKPPAFLKIAVTKA